MRKFLPFLLLSACAHKPDTKPEARHDAPAASSSGSSSSSSASSSSSSDKHADLDCGPVKVHFPFNSAEMDPAELSGLERSARCLKADAAMRVTIEGNADERGTEEYNLALGDQRAAAVAKYLQSLGVSQQQLKTVSYGKENPLCSEHDEACWARNRRADLKKGN